MTLTELILRVFALVWLTAFLVARHRQRLLLQPLPREPIQLPGHGIDTSVLQTRVRQVRDDQLIHRRTDSASLGLRRKLVQTARRRLAGSPFFHTAIPHEDARAA